MIAVGGNEAAIVQGGQYELVLIRKASVASLVGADYVEPQPPGGLGDLWRQTLVQIKPH